MQQNEEKHERVQLALPERSMPFEVAVECTLPDYRSEISRLLWVRPTLTPPERFIGGGKAEFSGKILFEILYTGPDGVLYGTDHEEGYSFSVPLEGTFAAEGAEIFAEPMVDAVISRVTGPRRLSVRCRAHAFLHGTAERSLAWQQHGIPEGAEPHLLCETVQTGITLGEGHEEILLSDSIVCEDDTRVICARGSVFLPEVRAANDEIRVSGEALITLLCCREEHPQPIVLEKRIPFESSVTLEGAHPEHSVCATGTVGRIELSVQDGQIALSAQVNLVVGAHHNVPVTVCHDIFLPGQHADCRFEEWNAWQSVTCCNRHFSICAERSTEELGIGEEMEILDHICEAEINEKITESGRTVLIGKLQSHLLCRRGGELCTQDATFPFRLAPGVGSENAHVECRVASSRMRMQNGILRVDAELQLCIRDTLPLQLRTLSEVTFTPSRPTQRAAIELYYPDADQTLWKIAKQYAVSPDALAEANGIACDAPDKKDSLAGKKFLLIP